MMDIDQLFAEAQTFFQNGRLEEAGVLAKKRSTKPEKDAALHLRWADLLPNPPHTCLLYGFENAFLACGADRGFHAISASAPGILEAPHSGP